jgi:hypothetical protein
MSLPKTNNASNNTKSPCTIWSLAYRYSINYDEVYKLDNELEPWGASSCGDVFDHTVFLMDGCAHLANSNLEVDRWMWVSPTRTQSPQRNYDRAGAAEFRDRMKATPGMRIDAVRDWKAVFRSFMIAVPGGPGPLDINRMTPLLSNL